MPTSAFESEVLPDALAPSSASPVPAFSEKETFCTIGLSVPGAATAELLHRTARGRAAAASPAARRPVPSTLQISRSRAMPWRAATSCFQLPSATSTGASARPIMIEEAIMMPPDALSATTR